jgi:nucleoside-diphosphate-sugar epimerase
MGNDMVLVDGAGGFIGSHVAEELHGANFQVRATDLPGADLSYLSGQGIETRPSDLLDKESLADVLSGVKAVVHCAAAFDLALPLVKLMQVNVDGTASLIQACTSAGVDRFIHFSTGGVYGIPQTCPVYEDHPIKPADSYSVSKARAEYVVTKAMDTGMRVTMFRPTNVYGPRGRYTAGSLFPTLCILKERGIRIPRMTGGPLINMVHVEDAAGAVRFALENESAVGKVYNLAETEIYEAGKFFDLIIEQFALPTRGSMKIRPGLMGIMGRIGMHMPSPLTVSPAQKFIEREWTRIKEKHKLSPALKPSLARDFMPFLIGPHAYSNERLRNDGYQVKHPSILKSFSDVVRWYQDMRWIPDYQAIG